MSCSNWDFIQLAEFDTIGFSHELSAMNRKIKTPMFMTPQDAEAAFYTAIEIKDIDVMQAVWLDSEHVTCIYPMGEQLQGRQEIVSGWQQIFTNDVFLNFEIKGVSQQHSEKLAVHILHQHIAPAHEFDEPTVIKVTNAYKLTDDGWRMVLHQALLSPQADKADIKLH